jgi:L-asparagine transporter-like permease
MTVFTLPWFHGGFTASQRRRGLGISNLWTHGGFMPKRSCCCALSLQFAYLAGK